MEREETTTHVLNVRDVPHDLMWDLREAAAKLRMTGRQFVLDAIQEKIDKTRSHQ